MLARRFRYLRLAAVLTLMLTLLPLSAATALALPVYQSAGEPEISAHEAIVVEYPSGRVLYSRNAHERMSPASLTKILTAILALEYGNLDDVVTVSPEDLVGESSRGLEAGEQQTLHNLLYGMLLPSGNDAAMSIARYLGTKLATADPTLKDPIARFSEMMNVRAKQLGLADSHFMNPHGLDMLEHYSTAYDLASLTWYALHIPTFNEIVKSVGYDAPGHPVLNTNEMLTRYPGADGAKTGWTDGCGLCLVTTATRDGHRLISVVLNSPHWYDDSTAVLDYGFAKLAAVPADPSAELLSVSQRDTVSWLLVNAASAPPIAVPAPQLAQGGGSSPLAAPVPAEVVSAPSGPELSEAQPVRANAPAAPVTLASTTTSNTSTGLILWITAFGLLGGVCLFFMVRVWGFRPSVLLERRRVESARMFRDSSHAPLYTHEMSAYDAPAPGRVTAWVGHRTGPLTPDQIGAPPPAPRTLGALHTNRRHEPNLLLMGGDVAEVHLERGVALAAQGRQGSSMSEFLLALKQGTRVDVADLSERYQLCSEGFLALSRAQLASGHSEDARRTLLHGVLVLPHERLLRLALYQLPAQE
jgi:D-alanyl-D-alanine carboxypeptidase